MTVANEVLESFHRVLVDEIRAKRPDYLKGPFTVAEIYQDLVPYPTHRDRIGVEMNGDYEDALIRMLAGEGDYLVLESEHALRELRSELGSKNPNTGVYREYAAVDVRLNPARLDPAAPAVHKAPAGAAAPERPIEVPSGPPAERTSRSAKPGPKPSVGTPRPESGGGRATVATGPGAKAAPASATEASGEACRWCKASLPTREGLKFCPFCGTDVHSVPCSACGEGMEPGWRFCIACGAERPA